MDSEGRRGEGAERDLMNSEQRRTAKDIDRLENQKENRSEERIRLNKFIASSGYYSRREADRLIEEGYVTVDGEKAVPGMTVSGKEMVMVKNHHVHPIRRKVVVAYYKPVGVTVTREDPHAEVTIQDVFHYPVPLRYAGRLDRDSEGLLLMTNDGDLINAMMRSANHHEKEYVVRTKTKIGDDDLKQMSKGIWLKDLNVKTRPCKVERLGKTAFRIVLTQGLNRQIRRMCRARGLEVKSIKRVRVLNVTLRGLKPGTYRELSEKEMKRLYELAGYDEARIYGT